MKKWQFDFTMQLNGSGRLPGERGNFESYQLMNAQALQVGSNKPRADIVIWEKGADQTQGTIKLIIECKKETVDARNATHSTISPK